MKRGCRIPKFCPVFFANRSGPLSPVRLTLPEDAVMAAPRTLPLQDTAASLPAVDTGCPGRNSGCSILSRGLERASAGLFIGLAKNIESKVA